jgi:hypothetical protein
MITPLGLAMITPLGLAVIAFLGLAVIALEEQWERGRLVVHVSHDG